MPDFTFTQPIRYYKSNDPYYFEVDNIPIRQLEENILFVKQLAEFTNTGGDGDTGTGSFLTETSELDLTNIKQLRPKLVSNRSIAVNAGKFNARVNGAYNIAIPLSKLLANSYSGQGADPFAIEEPSIVPSFTLDWTTTDTQNVWDNFVSQGSVEAFNMNGLEVTYTFHQSPGSIGNSWVTTTTGSLGLSIDQEGGENYPHYSTNSPTKIRWPGQTLGSLSPSDLLGSLDYPTTYSFENLQDIHLSFTRMWRSVFRTAVVDFPDSTIEIPGWDDEDYYYYDDAGTRVRIDGVTKRIDLLFAYALPVDELSTTVNDYSNGFCTEEGTPVPKTLTAPALGIIRGSGIGLSRALNSNLDPISIETKEGCSDTGIAGSKRILSNKNDEVPTSNYGITNSLGVRVHGSFPSPDDLINQAANLAMVGGTDSFQELQLIGQTAIPIAYVIINKGSTSLASEDVIDIRPFLRTTELAYNERAGIAAASPALSLANPAVGAFQLKDVVRRVYNKIQSSENAAQSTSLGKPVYMDYVMGGIAYGVEGTMLTMNDNSNSESDPWGTITTGATYEGQSFSNFVSSKAYLDDPNVTRRKALLEYFYNIRQPDLKHWLGNPNQSNNPSNYLNLPSSRSIPIFPEWQPAVDDSNWNQVFTGVARSADPTWWMWLEGVAKERPYRYVPGGVVSTRPSAPEAFLSSEYLPGYGPDDAMGFLQSCMKRIQIKLPSWANDYDVLVEYTNCSPFGGQIDKSATKNQVLLGNGLSVNKGVIESDGTAEFTITSAAQGLPAGPEGLIYQGRVLDEFGNGGSISNGSNRSRIQNRWHEWLTYSVCLPEFRETRWKTGTQQSADNGIDKRYTPKMGASYYPTVKFTIIAYPVSPMDTNKSYQEGGANASSKTLIPDSTIGGLHSDFGSIAPVYHSTLIDIEDTPY